MLKYLIFKADVCLIEQEKMQKNHKAREGLMYTNTGFLQNTTFSLSKQPIYHYPTLTIQQGRK